MSNKISFIIIEYYCIDDVVTCVDSIRKCFQGHNYEIIVSSNSCYTNSRQKDLTEKYGDITWLFNERNGGFAYGMNSGIAVSSGEFIVISNPDVRIISRSLDSAIKLLESNSKIGILGPQIRDSIGNLQDSCRSFMKINDFFIRLLKRFLKRESVLIDKRFDYTIVQDVDWVIGAFMIIKRSALEFVGGFDEGYFLYVEDMDLCKRFWDKGFQVFYYPLLQVEYKGDRKSTCSRLFKVFSNKYIILHFKSYFRFLKKHGFFPSRCRHPNY